MLALVGRLASLFSPNHDAHSVKQPPALPPPLQPQQNQQQVEPEEDFESALEASETSEDDPQDSPPKNFHYGRKAEWTLGSEVAIANSKKTLQVTLPTKKNPFKIPPEDALELSRVEPRVDFSEILGGHNYATIFHRLIYCEEFASTLNCPLFSINQVSLRKGDRPKKYVLLNPIKLLSRFRPRDLVFLVPDSPEKFQFTCFSGEIFSFESGSVLISLDFVPPNFDALLENRSTNVFELRRMSHRHRFRFLQTAIHNVHRYFGCTFLFPRSHSTQLDTPPPSVDANVAANKNLNSAQKIALNNILHGAASGPYILCGVPGSGKTNVLVELMMHLLDNDSMSRILVCTKFRPALCELALKYIARRSKSTDRQPSFTFMINWPEEKNHIVKELKGFCVTIRDAGEAGLRARLMFATSDTVGEMKDLYTIKHEHFTAVIIDDAQLLTEPETLMPISCLVRWTQGMTVVLAGDEHQLKPIVNSQIARPLLSVSLFSRLLEETCYCPTGKGEYDAKWITCLTNNLRSFPRIMETSKRMFYPKMEMARSGFDMAMDRVKFIDSSNSKNRGWHFSNADEAAQISRYVVGLVDAGVMAADVGIITPFYDQVRELSAKINYPRILIGQPGDFVGLEKKIVIVSLVEAALWGQTPKDNGGFLNNDVVSNFVVSRARDRLVIFGHSDTFLQDDFWRHFIDS